MKKIILITLAILIVLSSMAYAQRRLDYNGYMRSAKIYLDLTPKDYKKAAEMCESAIEYYPDKPPIEAHYILGTIYADKRLYQEMVDEFQYVMDICDNPKDKNVRKTCEKEDFVENIHIILEAKWREVYNRGVNALKRARSQDSLCQTMTDEYEMSQCREEVQRIYDDAQKSFEISTLVLPDSSHGWLNLGLIYYSTDRTDEALEMYRKAVEINPGDLPLLSNMTSIFFNNAQYDSAAHYYNRMLELPLDDKSKADVLYNMAFCLNEMGMIDSAIALLENVVKMTPDSPDALYNLGAFKIKKATEYINQRGNYTDSIEANPKKYQPIVDSLSNLLKDVYRSAAVEFERVVEIQPENEDALEWLGNGYFFLEEWNKAKNAYRKIVELHPDNEDAWCQLLLIALKQNIKAEITEAKAKCGRY